MARYKIYESFIDTSENCVLATRVFDCTFDSDSDELPRSFVREKLIPDRVNSITENDDADLFETIQVDNDYLTITQPCFDFLWKYIIVQIE